MKIRLIIIIMIFISGIALKAGENDSTKILIIGNSFTYYNSGHQTLAYLGTESRIPFNGATFLVPGYNFIDNGLKDTAFVKALTDYKWDYIILQDNQGWLVQDSATFPDGYTNIIKMIKDTIKKNNPGCRIVWFAGWGWKGGLPEYFPGDNSEKMIGRILYNSRYLNDNVIHEIVAPIGEAWIRCLQERPEIELWGADNAHPGPYGSYLMAAVLAVTIFKADISDYEYTAELDEDKAAYLRKLATEVVLDEKIFKEYSIEKFTPNVILYGNTLTCTDEYSSYQWFRDGQPIKGAYGKSYTAWEAGLYYLEVIEGKSNLLRSKVFNVLDFTNVKSGTESNKNPGITVTGNLLLIPGKDKIDRIYISNIRGERIINAHNENAIDISALTAGTYFACVIYNDGSIKCYKFLYY